MSGITSALKILTLSCDEAMRIASDSYEQELFWSQRAALRVHLVNCRWCRRVRRQLDTLHRVNKRCRTNGHDAACCAGHRLSREAKQRMIERLS